MGTGIFPFLFSIGKWDLCTENGIRDKIWAECWDLRKLEVGCRQKGMEHLLTWHCCVLGKVWEGAAPSHWTLS